jgi:class 3 adenylate cyclase
MGFLDTVVRRGHLREHGRVIARASARVDLDLHTLDELVEEPHVQQPAKARYWRGSVHSAPAAPPAWAVATHPPGPVDLPAQGERRQLTVLFCDVVDSTRLASRLDPEDWREILRCYQDATARVVERFDGHVAQYLGDGVLVYFGYPQAHEDDAERAVRAGLGIIEAVAEVNDLLEPRHALRLTCASESIRASSSWVAWEAARATICWRWAEPRTWLRVSRTRPNRTASCFPPRRFVSYRESS